MKIKDVMWNSKIFHFVSNFLQILFRHIYLIVLRTGYTWISKILLDSSKKYDHFEVQHAYVVKKIKRSYEHSNIFLLEVILLEILFRYTHGLQIWSRSYLANSKKMVISSWTRPNFPNFSQRWKLLRKYPDNQIWNLILNHMFICLI